MKRLFSVVTRASVRLWWVTILFAVIALGAGVWAALKMNQELLPNISFPQSFILTQYGGASSDDLLNLVTLPLEQEVVKVPGVVSAGMQSTTLSGFMFMQVVYSSDAKPDAVKQGITDAINKVAASGVPQGLKTTADLTPAVVTKILTVAPSMWKHFESQHILALQPEVLDAALKVNPDFIKDIDPITRDQLAAERIDSALNKTTVEKRPVALPGAWVMTSAKVPTIINFNLSSLPILTASISSADLKPEELRDLVEKELKPELEKIPGVAEKGVSVSGGQQIPPEVMAAAEEALARKQAADQATPSPAATAAPSATPAATQTTPAAATPAAPTTPAAVDANGVPVVPASWKAIFVSPIISNLLRTPVNTADDLFKAKDASGTTLTAAQAVNLISDKNANLLRDLAPEFVKYVVSKEADFVKNLNAKSAAAFSAAAWATATGEAVAPTLTGAWTTLVGRPGFKVQQIQTVRDLVLLPNGAAEALNNIVKTTPASLQSFAIKLVSSLSPDAIAYIVKAQPDFLSKLDPTVLRYFSAETLKSVSDFIAGLKDEALKKDLQAIVADPTKAAIAGISENAASAGFVDDPNAPVLASAWAAVPGMSLRTASDLLKKPFGLTAGGFLNAVAGSPQGGANLIQTLTPEVLLYLQSKDPTFFTTLTAPTLAMLTKETLTKLPKEVSERATAVPFTPDKSITRTSGAPSLTVSISKIDGENTVLVADHVDEYLKEFLKKHPNIQISPTFEQSGFIKESIGGVAREGGLGAVMAILVILLFLNFSFRSTLVTAVSIPTSVGIAFVFMYLIPTSVHPLVANSSLPDTLRTFLMRLFPASITLNIMTLSGLTVAIGRVVDDSIVVLENIYRQIQSGNDPKQAVLKGTRDVSLAIFAATVTTVVVFLPIGLSGGIIGEFFLPFGLAVTYSLLASFVVAITIVPVLAFLFIRKKDVPEEKEGRLERLYHGAIVWSLGHRFLVLGIALITLVVGLALFATRPTTFLPSFGEPQVSVSVSLPNGTPMAQTDALVRQFEAYAGKELMDKSISKYQVNIGQGGGLTAFLGGGGLSQNNATITLGPKVKGDELVKLTAQVRGKAEEIFGKQYVKVSKASLSEQGFGGFALVASGPAELLVKYDAEIVKTLGTVPGLTNVSSTLSQTASAGASSSSYLRINQTAAVQYSAELETNDTLGTTRKAIQAVAANKDLPKEITVGEGYQSQQQTQGFAQTFSSLGLAILIVYLVMVITFGSFVHPFTILFSLPLAVVGAALGLTITNRVVGISALIGLLMLVGIVVTNAIVLIDRVQQNRKEREMDAREALIEAGSTRLRPILMTAIATMIALLPLAIGLSEGAIIASELGTVVIGGLFSSTLLTLLVVPVVYSLLNGFFSRLFRRGEQPAKASSATGD